MTSIGIGWRENRWLRAIGFGFLAEAATVVTIIAIVLGYRYIVARGLPDASYAAFGVRTGEIVGIVGGALYTFLFAWLVTKRLSSRFIEHGIVVAVTAVAFSVAGSIAGHQGVPAGYLIASTLKLAGGALAGFLASKRYATAISV
ncbi:MAG: hypothetical protein ACREMS_01855 [Gemmatimonadaceae bacterium]